MLRTRMLPGPDGGEDCDHPGVHAPADGCAVYSYHNWVQQADNNGGHVMCCYEGEMSCISGIWRAHGQGTLTCYAEDDGPDGAVSWIYEGEFLKGKATGQGT